MGAFPSPGRKRKLFEVFHPSDWASLALPPPFASFEGAAVDTPPQAPWGCAWVGWGWGFRAWVRSCARRSPAFGGRGQAELKGGPREGGAAFGSFALLPPSSGSPPPRRCQHPGSSSRAFCGLRDCVSVSPWAPSVVIPKGSLLRLCKRLCLGAWMRGGAVQHFERTPISVGVADDPPVWFWTLFDLLKHYRYFFGGGLFLTTQ